MYISFRYKLDTNTLPNIPEFKISFCSIDAWKKNMTILLFVCWFAGVVDYKTCVKTPYSQCPQHRDAFCQFTLPLATTPFSEACLATAVLAMVTSPGQNCLSPFGQNIS